MSRWGVKKKWWRRRAIDEVRRRLSYLFFVQYPEDLLPVARQGCLLPPMDEKQIATTVAILTATLGIDVSSIADVLPERDDADFVRLWPGEHYRLLCGLTDFLRPELAVEIGTYKGAAAAVMSLNSKRVVTFDVVGIEEIQNSIPDFIQRFPNVTQLVGDLLLEDVWEANAHLFHEADVVFVDGPKDGVFEPNVVPRIVDVMRPGTILVLDDIRFASMYELWTELLDYPRIDIGCFGHFSGTGLLFKE